VSRAASRVRSPGTFTCARCPAVTAALDAVPEAYHDPAAVWWGPLHLPGHVVVDRAVLSNLGAGFFGQQRRWQDHQLGRLRPSGLHAGDAPCGRRLIFEGLSGEKRDCALLSGQSRWIKRWRDGGGGAGAAAWGR
jgi:hypothetical protein